MIRGVLTDLHTGEAAGSPSFMPFLLPLTPSRKIPGTLFESSSQFLTLRYSEEDSCRGNHNLLHIARVDSTVFQDELISKIPGTPFLAGVVFDQLANGDKSLFVFSHFTGSICKRLFFSLGLYTRNQKIFNS